MAMMTATTTIAIAATGHTCNNQLTNGDSGNIDDDGNDDDYSSGGGDSNSNGGGDGNDDGNTSKVTQRHPQITIN